VQAETSVVLNAEILRFAQDDKRIFRVDYVLRTWGATVLRPYMSMLARGACANFQFLISNFQN